MSDYTTNLNLLKKNPETDGNDYFNIKTILNDNWDKIDAGVAAKETPAGAQAKVDNLAGAGRTTQTVKGNADAIAALNQTVTSHSAETANTSKKGHIQIATQAETTAGIDTTKAVTPSGLKTEVDKRIANSLATSINQFLVSTAAGAWAVKTVAEIKTLLGLGSAAYTDSTAYATAAQGALATNALPKAGGNISGEVNHQDYLVTMAYLKDYAEAIGATPATTGICNFDLTTGNVFSVTPTGAITIGLLNPPANSRAGSATIWLTNVGTSYAKTFASSIKWVNDEIPDMSVVGKMYCIVLSTLNAGTTWRASCIGPFS